VSRLKSIIRVLIVEDSPFMQQLLAHILNQDPQFQIVGRVDNAESAIEAVENLQPDVITMDIQIKRANGLALTRTIMQTAPVPIVVISSSCRADDTQLAMEIMEAGALAAVPKPPSMSHPEFSKTASNIRQIVKDMAAVPVVKRRAVINTFTKLPVLKPKQPESLYSAVAIGASTGGPPAIQALLKELSPRLPVPVLLVQHIYPGFAPGLVEWLSMATPWKIKLINSNTKALPGTVYLCENGYQMGVRADGVIAITEENNNDVHHCPSVSYLFSSVASAFGPKAIGIILSGMGNDGAQELKLMRDKGALTIAQDQSSSMVYGMPAEAAKLNAAEHVLSPTASARLLNQIFGFSKQE
jgi:two-component system chemotaxis response regulator CheB